MTTVILVHGAWHGAWCWQQLVPLLQDKNYRVLVPDLPNHLTVTLDDYINEITNLLQAAPEPVILVGHSLAGVVISAAAAKEPKRVERLVYIAAFMPANGYSVAQQAKQDKYSQLGHAFEFITESDGSTWIKINPQIAPQYFYSHCEQSVALAAAQHLKPQASRILATPIEINRQVLATIPKQFFCCEQDQCISPSHQQKIAEGLEAELINLNSDHSPMLSVPEMLAKLI